MVRRSACLGSKSVDARTISSPTRQPAAFRTSYRGAACVGRVGQLGPGVRPITVQVQGSAHEHDPAVTAVIRSTHSTDIFVFDVVGEGNGRLARMGPGFGADFQFPVQHDPLGGQFKVGVVGEAEFAVDRQTAQRRRTDVEDARPCPLAMVTLSPAAGTLRSGQVAGSDQRVCLAAGAPAF